MKTSRTVIALSVVLTGLCFGVGGVVAGYFWGYVDSIGLNAPSQSAVVATALRAHRKGEVDNALSLLETFLDTSLIERRSYDLRPHLLAGLVVDSGVQAKVMQIAADYRAEFPSAESSSGVHESVDETVARYKSDIGVPPNKSLERTRER